jgi:hypothetical protein
VVKSGTTQYFQLSLIFVFKLGSHWGQSGTIQCSTMIVLITNNQLFWHCFLKTNTLAYFKRDKDEEKGL